MLALPLTPETKTIINAEVLRSMRRSAYLIHIARGALVDEAALFTALTEGWIAGAGVDAFVTEPLPADSPLWSVPNLFVTPHISWSSPHTQTRTLDLFLDNLHRYRTGQPLRNIVDRHAGYCTTRSNKQTGAAESVPASEQLTLRLPPGRNQQSPPPSQHSSRGFFYSYPGGCEQADGQWKSQCLLSWVWRSRPNCLSGKGMCQNSASCRMIVSSTTDISVSQNCYKVMLLSGANRKEANQFYEKVGFKQDRKTGFFATPEVNQQS